VVSVAWLSSWPSVRGHSGQEPTAGRPSLPPNLDTTRVVICTVSCLNGHLPLAERAAVRSDLGSGLALDRPTLSEGTGEKVPETPKDLRAFGVDEVCR